jgi:hypothetical protein
MVCCSVRGALKLCERHPVNGYTFSTIGLASYYAIGTYSVLGAIPILGCISRFGRFTGTPRDYLRDPISNISFEIVSLYARFYLRYLFVLATVHYDVLSDGQYRLDVSKAADGAGWWV